MVDVLTETVIDRPLDEVADFVAEPTNAPKWYANIESVEWETSPPLALGSRMAFTARFLGRKLTYTYEVIEFEPRDHLVMRTAEGPFPMETTYTWRRDGEGGTRMSLRNRGKPSGFSVLFAPFMGMAVRRANRKDLRYLKTLLENRTG